MKHMNYNYMIEQAKVDAKRRYQALDDELQGPSEEEVSLALRFRLHSGDYIGTYNVADVRMLARAVLRWHEERKP